jgi:hypothetical protein
MRNYELIKAIYDRCPDMAKYPKEYSIDQIFDRTQDIIDMIELHRPEIAGKLPTEESLMEEMRKYPHRDNHMD